LALFGKWTSIFAINAKTSLLVMSAIAMAVVSGCEKNATPDCPRYIANSGVGVDFVVQSALVLSA
jgi:hypothetical protein